MNSDLKPSFILSKRQRGKIEMDVLDEYRELAKGFYIWEGLPDDVPEGYIEGALFDYGCVGMKLVPKFGVIVCPASVKLRTIYNYPSSWIPCGLTLHSDPLEIMGESENPALYIGKPIQDRILPYVTIIEDANLSLDQNVIGMRQPVVFAGVPGNSADSVVLNQEIETGERSIPVVSIAKVQAQVLDLKVSDFTHPLIETMQDRDAKVLTLMSIDNEGVEKASGVNMAESTAHQGKLILTSTLGLKLRQDWCDKINPVLQQDCEAHNIPFTPISVSVNPEYQDNETVETDPNQAGNDDEQQ